MLFAGDKRVLATVDAGPSKADCGCGRDCGPCSANFGLGAFPASGLAASPNAPPWFLRGGQFPWSVNVEGLTRPQSSDLPTGFMADDALLAEYIAAVANLDTGVGKLPWGWTDLAQAVSGRPAVGLGTAGMANVGIPHAPPSVSSADCGAAKLSLVRVLEDVIEVWLRSVGPLPAIGENDYRPMLLRVINEGWELRCTAGTGGIFASYSRFSPGVVKVGPNFWALAALTLLGSDAAKIALAIQASILLHELVHLVDNEIINKELGILTLDMCNSSDTEFEPKVDDNGESFVFSFCTVDGNQVDPASGQVFADWWTEYTAAELQGRFLGLNNCAASEFGSAYLHRRGLLTTNFKDEAKEFVDGILDRGCLGALTRWEESSLRLVFGQPAMIWGIVGLPVALAVLLMELGTGGRDG